MRLSPRREADLLTTVRRAPEDCVRFADSAYTRPDGFLAVHRAGRQELLHRRLYREARDPGLGHRQLVARCTTFGCVNPWHYELATKSHRRLTTGNAAKTECPYGHPYDEENTYVSHAATGQRRKCRTCERSRRLGLD